MSEVRRLKELESENPRLKKIVADMELEIDMLKIESFNGSRVCSFGR